MKPEEILLKEHEELVQLYVHEDKVHWNLIYFFLIFNSFIVSLIGAFFSIQNLDIILFIIFIISISTIGFTGNFVLLIFSLRSRIYITSRLNRALQIETNLAGYGIDLKTFTSCEGRISNKIFLLTPDGKEKELNWFERRSCFKISRTLTALALICYFIVIIINLIYFISQIFPCF